MSKLTILLGAGMTLFSAWNKITTNYSNKRKNNTIPIHPLYEEMLITCHEIESGVGEARAYESLWRAVWIASLPEIFSLLVQISKRTRGLVQLLEEEVSDAFEERKNLAKKSGEEAGTKMLFPMMMMFGIIIVIIMVPAFLSLQ